MRDDLTLKILSPENTAFTGVIRSVLVPAALGQTEIFLNHASFVSFLLTGIITVRHADGADTHYFTNGGYIEVHDNQVTLILDDIINPKDLSNEFYQIKISELNTKLSLHTIDDNQYEHITQSIALYQQYLS